MRAVLTGALLFLLAGCGGVPPGGGGDIPGEGDCVHEYRLTAEEMKVCRTDFGGHPVEWSTCDSTFPAGEGESVECTECEYAGQRCCPEKIRLKRERETRRIACEDCAVVCREDETACGDRCIRSWETCTPDIQERTGACDRL